MANTAWKVFERACARMIQGSRFWANSGEKLDVIGPSFVGQCKKVTRISLNELTDLTVEVEDQALQLYKTESIGNPDVHHRIGIVFARPKGRKTTVIMMTQREFKRLLEWAEL